MKLKLYERREAYIFFCCGLILIMLYLVRSSIFPMVIKSKLDKLESIAGLYILLYAGLLFVLGSYSFYLSRYRSSLCSKTREVILDIWRTIKRSFQTISHYNVSNLGWLWLAGFFLIGVIIRFYYSNQLMRSDEGATYYYFVSGSMYRSFIYLEPNNHVLHTLLARLSIFIFGNTPVFLRLPAILSGLICLPLMFIVGRKLLGNKSGYVSMALMAVYPIIILFDTQARGYSMVNMFTLTGLYLVLSIIRNNSSAKQLLLALNCALGLFVMPSFLFPTLGLFLFLIISICLQPKSCINNVKKAILPSAVLTILFTFVLYTPVVLATGGYERIIANDTVLPLSWEEFISKTPDHFYLVFQRNMQGIPTWLLLISLLISLFGAIWLFIKKKSKLLLLILSFVLAAATVYFAKRSIPFPRTWLFILPLAFMLVDAGYTAIAERLKKQYQTALAIAIGFVIGFVSIYQLPNNTLRSFNTFGTFEEAEKLSNWLTDKLPDIHGIHLAYPTRYTTLYYLLQHHDFEKIHLLSNSNHPNYFVIKKGKTKVSEVTRFKVKKVFVAGDALVYTQTEVPTKNKK